jgi:hypothetical protein
VGFVDISRHNTQNYTSRDFMKAWRILPHVCVAISRNSIAVIHRETFLITLYFLFGNKTPKRKNITFSFIQFSSKHYSYYSNYLYRKSVHNDKIVVFNLYIIHCLYEITFVKILRYRMLAVDELY